MQEHRVTVAKQQYTLTEPFFVLATQNPLEMEGTYPLPEAQLDRFFFKIDVPFPSEEELHHDHRAHDRDRCAGRRKVASGDDVLAMQRLVRGTSRSLRTSGLRRARPARRRTRTPSTRRTSCGSTCATAARRAAAQAMVLGAKINALLDGRYTVAYADVQSVALPPFAIA